MSDHLEDFAKRLEELVDESLICHEGLWHLGPTLIDRCVMKWGSYRKASKRIGLSPSYMSQIMHSQKILTPERYLKIHDLLTRPNRKNQ